MLALEAVDAAYGDSQVLFDVSLSVGDDEVVSLLGRNGAGKTTILRAIVGLTPPRSGRVVIDGEDVAGLPPERIANRGIGYVPQDRRLFPRLTVAENLVMGLGTARLVPGRVDAVLERFPAIADRRDQRAGTLSGGERQLVAIARALMREPALLLLDEPTEGLMPALLPEIERIVRELSAAGYAILLATGRVDLALSLSDRVALVENGRVRAAVTPDALAEDESLLDRYLGI